MTIVAQPGAYSEDLRTLGGIPGGPRGSAIGSGIKIGLKLLGRGSRRLGRRVFTPKRYTYPGATSRGIGAGTIIVSLLPDPDVDSLDGPSVPINGQATNRFQQRNYRQRGLYRRRRCDNRHRHRNCC